MLARPHLVYINWSSYDELSDVVELDEAVAMRQMDHLRRLKAAGVPFDAYLMDAFWHAPDGGYRTWRRPHWPDGPDRWLDACAEAGVMPGLWLGTNNLITAKMEAVPAWRDSLAVGGLALSMSDGGFWPDFLTMMREWYARGVRVFKFDFAAFGAGTPRQTRTMLPSEIVLANRMALESGLREFRADCPEAILLAYNGFDEQTLQSNTWEPFRRTVGHGLCGIFDGLYCGDPRPADVPSATFWRSKDVYSDHQVWNFLQNGVPSRQIDSSAFMIGTTGTAYFRGKAMWKGMLLLELVRGGWTNTIYGNLDLLDDADAAWMARAVQTFLPRQHTGEVEFLGQTAPGAGEPYGWRLRGPQGVVEAWVNPSQAFADVPVPAGARLVFAEGRQGAMLDDRGRLTLPPEHLALIAAEDGHDPVPDFGRDATVPDPRSAQRFAETAVEARELTMALKPSPDLTRRIVVRQADRQGHPVRSTGGAPPDGRFLHELITVEAFDGEGQSIPLRREDDKQIWSGLSWAVADVPSSIGESAVMVRVVAADERVARLHAEVWTIG